MSLRERHFATTGLSDVYDGTLWKDFITVDQSAFLSECNNYGLTQCRLVATI